MKIIYVWCTALLLASACMSVHARDQPLAKPSAPTVPEIVATAFGREDFPELERLYAIYGKAGVRSALTGIPRVQHFWMGINKINNPNEQVTEDHYIQLDALTNRWSRDHPRSVLAQLLYAATLRAHAWYCRGSGYANTVSPEAWAEFRKYIDLSLAQLQRAKPLAANDSSWDQIMLSTGRDLNWSKQELLAVFEAGIAKNPDHDGLYFSMESALLPKWGGDLESVESFIAYVDRTTRDKRGSEMYARLYADASYGELNQHLFSETDASWPRMKVGFDDLVKRYPHPDHRNEYAYFACMAGDVAALRKQLELIDGDFEPMFWGDKPEQTFERCKTAAHQT